MKRVGKINNSTFCVKISVIEHIFFKCDEKSNQDMAPTYLGFFQETWIFLKKKSWIKIFWNAIFSKQTQWQDVVGWWWDEKNRSPNFYWFMSSKNIFEFCVGKEIKFQARYIPNIKIGIYFFLADIFKWLCYKLTLNNYYFSLQTPYLVHFYTTICGRT